MYHEDTFNIFPDGNTFGCVQIIFDRGITGSTADGYVAFITDDGERIENYIYPGNQNDLVFSVSRASAGDVTILCEDTSPGRTYSNKNNVELVWTSQSSDTIGMSIYRATFEI